LGSRLRLVSIAICATLLIACTELSPLRPGTQSVVPKNGYTLAFVEFGEQGSYQDSGQLPAALSVIRETANPLVITYVHGWQNNAKSGDVQSFESLLARLNGAPAIRNAGFHIVGIYLSWRGKITDVPVLK
jgi:hypothetical protein